MTAEESSSAGALNKSSNQTTTPTCPAKSLNQAFGSICASTSKDSTSTATLRTLSDTLTGSPSELSASSEKYSLNETLSLTRASWTSIRLKFRVLRTARGRICRSICSSSLGSIM